MKYDEIDDELKGITFKFFYYFSRFEFVLKKNGYYFHPNRSNRANVDWNRFLDDNHKGYVLSKSAVQLIAERPRQQIVDNQNLSFEDVRFADGESDLVKVGTLIKTVRNNLFHGGKHGDVSWDDQDRMKVLLGLVLEILGEIAEIAGLQNDYQGAT